MFRVFSKFEYYDYYPNDRGQQHHKLRGDDDKRSPRLGDTRSNSCSCCCFVYCHVKCCPSCCYLVLRLVVATTTTWDLYISVIIFHRHTDIDIQTDRERVEYIYDGLACFAYIQLLSVVGDVRILFCHYIVCCSVLCAAYGHVVVVQQPSSS